MDSAAKGPRELPVSEVTTDTDTRDILAHARKDAVRGNFDDVFIVDIDSHHMETESWREIVDYVEDDVVRFQALDHLKNRTGSPPYGLNGDLALRYQDCGGRILHQSKRGEAVEQGGLHRDVVLAQRAYESFGADYTVVFPTPMLNLGMHPQPEMETLLGRAYNRWFAEHILPQDDRLKTLMYLPFNDPEAAIRTVEEFSGHDGVIGFMVTSVRHKPVHHNAYMKLYRTLEAHSMPLGFHAGYHWQDPSMMQINRFGAMHALSFVWCNVLHLTNWVWNGLPERFPGLDVIWIESGLAWVPWLMQRLDHQYMMRTSEAPLLKRPPGEYIREMYYTTQPLELDYPKAVELTFEMIDAPTQLMYASDWPHWDFDAPNTIWDLPFLNEDGKRNILGLNAARLFNLPVPAGKAAAAE